MANVCFVRMMLKLWCLDFGMVVSSIVAVDLVHIGKSDADGEMR